MCVQSMVRICQQRHTYNSDYSFDEVSYESIRQKKPSIKNVVKLYLFAEFQVTVFCMYYFTILTFIDVIHDS